MSRKVTRNKSIDTTRINFYCNLDWKGRTKRLRKKAKKIILNDFCISCEEESKKKNGLEEYGGWCYKCGTYYAECGCK